MVAADPTPVQHYSIFYLMLTLGLRRGEALGLRWRDVDFAQGTLYVRQALTVAGDSKTLVLKEVKTPTSRRSLPLSSDGLSVLSEHRERMMRLFEDLELVFVSGACPFIDPKNLRCNFNETCEVAAVR